MARVRLAVAVANAMAHTPAEPGRTAGGDPVAGAGAHPVAQATDPAPLPSPAGEAETLAPPLAPPARDAPARRRPFRGVLAGLRRPAEYLRAYLTASVEHQLHLQAARVADLAGATARLETLSPVVHHLNAHGERVAAHLRDVSAHLESVSLRLEETSAHVDRVSHHVSQRLSEMETRLAAAQGDVTALVRRGLAVGDHTVDRLDQALGVLGPRFDELEIKVRPLVEVDAESVAVRTADGYVMLPRSEPLFVTAVVNATSGGLEPGARRVLRALLRPGDAAADVGANVGLLTTAMAFAVGPAGRVWAFEPEARVRRQLERTLHLNGLRQVSLSAAAVGAEAGRLVFHQSPIIGHSSLYALPEDERAGETPVEVEVARLDDVVPRGTALAAVKIDVEGAELDVLRGMGRVIADSPDLAVIAEFGPSHLHRVGITPQAWFDAFAAHGLAPRLIAEPSGATSPTGPADLVGVESANLVFVRPGGAADERLPR